MNECNHKWIANSGQGGKPLFTGRSMLMHVKCEKCNSRTWMDKAAWEKVNKTKRGNRDGHK